MTYYGDMVKTCLQCTLNFDSKRANKKYCSTKCSNKAAYKRKPKKAKSDLKTRELVKLAMTPWVDNSLYEVTNKIHKGRGEIAYRRHLGLPELQRETWMDIPERRGEVKDMENYSNGEWLYNFVLRFGKRKDDVTLGMISRLVFDANRMVDENEEFVSEEIVQEFLKLCPTKKDFLRLPQYLQTKINELLKPSKVFSYLNEIILVCRSGWLRVPSEDFDEAFSFYSTTQARFQYKFDRNYLRKRITIAHEQNKERDHVLRNGSGEDLERLLSPDSTSSPVSGPGHMGNSEGAHQPERVTGGLCQERDVRRDGDPGEPLTENDSCDLSLQGREEDCRRVFSDPFEW